MSISVFDAVVVVIRFRGCLGSRRSTFRCWSRRRYLSEKQGRR